MLMDRIDPATGWDYIERLKNDIHRRFPHISYGAILGGAYQDVNMTRGINLKGICYRIGEALTTATGRKHKAPNVKEVILDGKAIDKNGKKTTVADIYGSLLFLYENGHFKKYTLKF